MSCEHPNRFTVICVDGEPLGAANPMPTTGGGGGGNVVVTDMEDGAGDSVMDPATNSVRVNIVAGAGSGGTAQTDKSAFVEGAGTFTPVGGVFNDALAGDVAEDEAAAARITRRRAVHANLRDNDGVEVGTATDPIRTDPTGTTAQPVTDNGDSLTVDGSVSIAGTAAVDQVDTASIDYDTGGGTVNQTVMGIALPGAGGPVAGGTATNPVRVDPTGTTPQPVTGTVAVTGNVTVDQGTDPWVVDQENTADLDYDTGGGTVPQSVVGIALPGSGGPVAGGTLANPVRVDPTGTTPQPVTGTVAITGNVTVDQGTDPWVVDQENTADLDYDTGGGTVNQAVMGIALPGTGGPVAGGTLTNPVRTDPTGTTPQPVTGTVDVGTIGPGDDTIGRVKLTDGTDVATIRDLTNSDPLDVAIVDANGDQITSFGGGTQYTDGDVDADPIGTAVVWRDTGDEMRVVSEEKPLPVNVVEGGGSSADVIVRNGFNTLIVYDPTCRKMLQEILLQLAELQRKIFET